MAVSSANTRNYRPWTPTAARRAEEQARKNWETQAHVVRVILQEFSDDAVVYRKGRLGLTHQFLTPEQIEMLDEGKAYFEATWSTVDNKWVLQGKVPSFEC